MDDSERSVPGDAFKENMRSFGTEAADAMVKMEVLWDSLLDRVGQIGTYFGEREKSVDEVFATLGAWVDIQLQASTIKALCNRSHQG